MDSDNLIVGSVARIWRELSERSAGAPQPTKWVLFIRPEVYSRLLPMSRRKLQLYTRKAWRDHG